MRHWFAKESRRVLPAHREYLRVLLLLCIGCGLPFTALGPTLANAQGANAQGANAQEPAVNGEDTPSSGIRREPPSRPGIEEFVVRGGESNSSADFAVADSVTGFGAEDLAAIGAQDISDLASFTPNLEIVTYGATSPTFFIRGVGLNDFNSNSTGAVAIYQDDVARNAPALQLSTLFDVDAVNVLRGPQGTGLARNASAGAIRIYSRKPTGDFGGFLRSEFGNFNALDFEGALEAPIYQDILSGRFAFRFTERDGTMKNRCGDAPAFEDRVPREANLRLAGKRPTDAPASICGEVVENGQAVSSVPGFPSISNVPEGLPSRLNDVGNWAARGTLLFQPTLDMTWLVNAHGSRRDEYTRVGQAIGTKGFSCLNPDLSDCASGDLGKTSGILGGTQGLLDVQYQSPEIRARLLELAPCFASVQFFPNGTCFNGTTPPKVQQAANAAKIQLAEELARNLDSDPLAGDFNLCGLAVDPETGLFRDRDPSGQRCKKDKGRTTNDTYGVYLRGDWVLPFGMELTTISGYDTYKRLLDIDLDFSPETLFEIRTEDEGWQATTDLQLKGQLGDEGQLRWDVGGWFLREQLDVLVRNDLGKLGAFGVGTRDYTQDLWSAAGYARLSFDFWENFTLDGGFRYNWEQKKLDYSLMATQCRDPVTFDPEPCLEVLNESWQAPTGTVRLTYRFRDDTHVFWKYTRGWKPGTFNATSSVAEGVSVARPEFIDAFETGIRANWLDGRVSLDGSIFYYAYDDYQLFTAQQFAGGQPEFVILNASKVEVFGAEIDAVVRPWYGSFVNVRFGWLESQFLDFVQIQQQTIFQNGTQFVANKEIQNTGNRVLNSPQFTVSITAEQTLPLGRFGSLTARYDGTWTDTTFFDASEGRGIPNEQNVHFLPEGTIAQRPFWLHNLRLAYRRGPFEVAGWVRNLTNETFKTFGFDGSTFNETSIYFVGDPRTYGATVTMNF